MKLNKLSIAITLIASSSVFAAALFNGANMPEKKDAPSTEIQQQQTQTDATPINRLQQVAVTHVELGNYTAEVIGYGEAKSRYELNFTSEINGTVNKISAQFDSGKVAPQGTQLATIDSTNYQQALTLALSNVAQAELDLLEEQRLGEQAKSEWQRSGLSGEPDSPLVLRKPQLAQATAALENAKQEQKKAQHDLNKTKVSTPFDALIVSRDIDLGSYIQTGTQIATLYSIDEVEIAIPLSESQWYNLPTINSERLTQHTWPVQLQSSDGSYQWQGYVNRVEQHLSQDTRQRALIVVVEKPLEQTTSLYPGTFVQASISGKHLEQLWQLPASSLSQQGELWLVNEDGFLSKQAVEPEFEKSGMIYVKPIHQDAEAQTRIVKRPLSSFQVGRQVQALVEGES